MAFVAIVGTLHSPGLGEALGMAAAGETALWRTLVAVVGVECFAFGLILGFMGRGRVAASALARARRDADDAVAAMSRFLADMSHEIKTPLNGVIGTAELLRSPNLNEAQRARLLELQEQSTKALLALVNGVLDWSKVEAGKVGLETQPLNLRRIISGSNELFAPQAFDKGIELTSSCDPDVPRAFIGDASRLRQIIDNLVGNAVKFTASGGVHIDLSLDADVPTPAPGGRSCRLRIEVADTGIGIEANRLRSLFEAFTQGDASVNRRHGSTGLGLAISAELARLMGGRIDVTSSPGQGSTFTLSIPLAVHETPRDLRAPPQRGDVLLAAASMGLKRHMKTILRDLGIDPVVARELPAATSPNTCRLLLVDAPVLATLAQPQAWLQSQIAAGRRVVVITPLGTRLGIDVSADVPVLYKPVRRRSLKAVLDAADLQFIES